MPSLKYKRVALVLNRDKPQVPAAAKKISAMLRGFGAVVVAERQVSKAALIISLGGDGTLLRAASLAQKKGVPILGVNLGTLGFVTSLSMDQVDRELPRVLGGRYRVERRSMVEGRITKGGKVRRSLVALNELLVAKGFPGRVAELDCEINGRKLAVYRADGLIIATPTGSTAYALSAGGPILEPGLKALLLAPVSPHALSNRPLVVPDRSVIRVTTHSTRDSIYAAADGQERVALKNGEFIEVRRARQQTRLLLPPGASYYELLRTKLGWRGK